MTAAEYRDYVSRVEAFFAREGITNLSTGHISCPERGEGWTYDDDCPNGHGHRDLWDEAFFSWHHCDCCRRQQGGDREHATGWNPDEKRVQEYTVCIDCIYFAEYGRLDDTTMMEVEKDEAAG